KNKKLVRLSKLLMGLDALTEAEDTDVRAVVIARLTPEESAHEAEAVKDETPMPAPASENEEAIAEEVAASADDDLWLADAERRPKAEEGSGDDLDFSDDDAPGPEAEAAPGKPRPGLVRKGGAAKIPEKPIGLAKQAKPAALGARLRARSEAAAEK